MLNNFNIGGLFFPSLCFLIHNQRNAIKGEKSVFTWPLKQFGGYVYNMLTNC